MIELIGISEQGRALDGAEAPSGLPREAAQATAAMYATFGFERPWIGYLIRRNGEYLGVCGFKGPPVGARVEIAYFTFPEHERKGVATEAARRLIALARRADATLLVTAHTLPEENASTRILRRLGFSLTGAVQDPRDGEVWEWRLPQRHSAWRMTWSRIRAAVTAAA